MTISYSGGFGRLLFRWQASLWKSVWKELALFLFLFYCVALLNRFAFNQEFQAYFSKLVIHLDEMISGHIPISFLLGLYVVTITKRWWEQFENIGWPDNLFYQVSAFLRNPVAQSVTDCKTPEERARFDEADDEMRVKRRTIVRYAVLASVLAWRNISSRVLKRFPTANHLTAGGLMTEEEKDLYQSISAPYGRWFLPINWIQTMIMHEIRAGRIDKAQTNMLLTTLHAYKDKFIRLFVCDWVTIPLTYTQVVTVATYGYFAICLIARQDVQDRSVYMYIPIFTVLQFLFYMGWLKVGEHLIHPFGDEDDDFELNYIIDRHLCVGMMIVDGINEQLPEITRDKFLSEGVWLPHTKASRKINEFIPHSHFGIANLPFQEMELTERMSKDRGVSAFIRKRTLKRSNGTESNTLNA